MMALLETDWYRDAGGGGGVRMMLGQGQWEAPIILVLVCWGGGGWGADDAWAGPMGGSYNSKHYTLGERALRKPALETLHHCLNRSPAFSINGRMATYRF